MEKSKTLRNVGVTFGITLAGLAGCYVGCMSVRQGLAHNSCEHYGTSLTCEKEDGFNSQTKVRVEVLGDKNFGEEICVDKRDMRGLLSFYNSRFVDYDGDDKVDRIIFWEISPLSSASEDYRKEDREQFPVLFENADRELRRQKDRFYTLLHEEVKK